MHARVSVRAWLLGVATLLVVPSHPVFGADERVVNVYNWSDYIDAGVLEDFTRETGIKVTYDVFDSNELLETKLLAGSSGYDVVVPSGTFLARQIQAGVFQKLDKSKLPNLRHMWDVVSERTALYDPGNEYAVNYLWGTTGIGYDASALRARMADAPLGSWRLIFDKDVVSRFADCGIHVLDAPAELIPTALNYLGLPPNSHAPDDIAKAGELLASIRPYVQKFHSSEYINALANGDICLAVGWSGDIFQARARASEAGKGLEVSYVIPVEGAQMWFDMMAIPADARNVEEAHALIDFMMRPDVIARSSNYVFYANGNLASQPLLDKAVAEDPAVYPDAATLAKLFVTTPYPPPVQRVVTRTWTRVKTGQ